MKKLRYARGDGAGGPMSVGGLTLVALFVVAALLTPVAAANPVAVTPRVAAVRASLMVPSDLTPGPPLYRRVGSTGGGGTLAPSVFAATTFSCQTTSPPTCYGPAQIRAAYGFSQLSEDGSGQTIVIIDAFQSPTINQDLASFDSVFGLPAPPSFNIVAPDGLTPFDPTDAGQIGWAGEISLDVEWAHAIAPAANIELVLAKSSSDPDLQSAVQYAVTNHLGNVISMSYGEAEACMAAQVLSDQHAAFQAATDAGISLFASSGDQGAAEPTCDNSSYMKAAITPASDPLVTSVGGTFLQADGTTGAYQSESVWNEPDFNAAGGGGFSTLYPVPGYQSALNLSARGLPDVAYNAGFERGVLTVWSSSDAGSNLVFAFGGTSAGSPQWAALTALADQAAGRGLGSINPTLYQVASNPSTYAQDFHDTTVGDNTFHGASTTISGYSAATGWDPASGLGSPQANALVPRLALGYDVTPPTISCASPTSGWHNKNVSITCTARDSGSGLADPSKASFTLTTDVPAGEATADAATNSVQVCDKAGNCAQAGPFTGIMIDRAAPQVTLQTPAAGATYSALKFLLSGQSVHASYSCSDVGSGIASCQGTEPNGAKLNIGLLTLGRHNFTVTATDKAGNKTTVTHTYTVTL